MKTLYTLLLLFPLFCVGQDQFSHLDSITTHTALESSGEFLRNYVSRQFGGTINKPDSLLEYDYLYFSNDSLITQRQQYLYEFIDNTLEKNILSQKKINEAEEWDTLSITNNSYNTENLLDTTIVQQFGGPQTTDYRTTFEYNDDQLPTRSVIAYSLFESDEWINNVKKDYDYNMEGNVALFTESNWDQVSGEWINWKQTEYQYGPNTQTSIVSNWINDEWSPAGKIDFTYTELGLLQTYQNFYLNTEEEWILNFSSVNEYQEELISQNITFYFGADMTISAGISNDYNYFPEMDSTEIIVQNWNTEAEDFQLDETSQKNIYLSNEFDQFTYQERQAWDPISETWDSVVFYSNYFYTLQEEEIEEPMDSTMLSLSVHPDLDIQITNNLAQEFIGIQYKENIPLRANLYSMSGQWISQDQLQTGQNKIKTPTTGNQLYLLSIETIEGVQVLSKVVH